MRVLVNVVGEKPHLYLIQPLAWAFRAAGHEVRLASARSVIEDLLPLGLPVVPIDARPGWSMPDIPIPETDGDDDPWPLAWSVNLHRLDAQKRAILDAFGRYLVAIADATADTLVAFARDWRPDLIVYDADSYAGAVAAAALGIPGIRFLYGTSPLPWMELRQPPDRAAPDPQAPPLPEYAEVFARFGAPVRTQPATYVDHTPPSLRLLSATPCRDMRFVPFNGPGIVPVELRAPARARPRVCVTWGHTLAKQLGSVAANPFRAVIEAVVAAGAEAMVVTNPEQLAALGPLADAVRGFAGVPLQFVLAQCDAIVHHGGDGTALTAASLGLPQLVISRSPDDDLTGGQLATTGAALHMRHRDVVENPAPRKLLAGSVDRLLTDGTYQNAAGRLRAEMERQPTPAEVVPGLIELAGG